LTDITGCAVQSHGEIRYTREPSADLADFSRTGDDDYADVLVRMWSLATGRIPRLDVRPCQLTEQELLWFWDDHDLVHAAGRHAKIARPFPASAAR
jgi:hypothetical protein